MNRARSGSRSEKLIFVPSDAVITRGPGFLCSLISAISPHRIRFSLRNQKRCSIPSWETTIVPGNENISAAARNIMTTGVKSCHHSPEPRRSSLKAAHAGKRTISGQAKYVNGSGENSTVPSPTSLAERARPGPRKCIHARRSAETRLAALSNGFQIIEIILTPKRAGRRPPQTHLRAPRAVHPPRIQRILNKKRYTGAVGRSGAPSPRRNHAAESSKEPA